VLLDVEDTGPGVPPDIRAKIFDPFFTTKPEGTGTGLGLSICYGIVRDHRGRIWVDPAPAAGATFHVTLPRDPRAVLREEAAAPAATAAPRRDDVTALIVDDEEGLRNAAVRFLARCGIKAEAVADGREALPCWRAATSTRSCPTCACPAWAARSWCGSWRATGPSCSSA